MSAEHLPPLGHTRRLHKFNDAMDRMRGESDRPPSRPRPTDLCRRKHTNGKKDPALTQSLMLIFKEQGRGPKSPRYEYIPISYVPYTTSAIHHSVNLPRIAWHHITSRRPTSAHPLHPARRHLHSSALITRKSSAHHPEEPIQQKYLPTFRYDL